MQCFDPPDGFDAPEFDPVKYQGEGGIARYAADVRAFVEKLGAHARTLGYDGPLTGREVCFPCADGMAQYVVFDHHGKLSLIHVAAWDGYAISAAEMRGLRKSDVLARLEMQRSWKKTTSKRIAK